MSSSTGAALISWRDALADAREPRSSSLVRRPVRASFRRSNEWGVPNQLMADTDGAAACADPATEGKLTMAAGFGRQQIPPIITEIV